MRIFHLRDVAEFYSFIRRAEQGPLSGPLRRILHLLFRKQLCQTVLVESGVSSDEYRDECLTYNEGDPSALRRFHFFDTVVENVAGIDGATKAYCGYCDVRPDGSLVKSLIADRVIIRPDTYACLVCRVTETVTLPTGASAKVVGFPHVEKDNGVVMCSQAAIATVVDYWNHQRPGTFTATTSLAISQQAGKTPDMLQKNESKGLSLQEIESFFKSQNFPCRTVFYGKMPVDQKEVEDPSVQIYGYLESGFPVIAIVETSGSPHALTVVGHTFDKNIWTALADRYYYSKPLSGVGAYHSNLSWIKYFIVQDDNLGPYFFLPREILPGILSALVIPLPHADINVDPKAAERAAFMAMAAIAAEKGEELSDGVTPENDYWLKILLDHADPEEGGGWVLRPVLATAQAIVESYVDSEFASLVKAEFDRCPNPCWRVEISWPNLYCYHARKAGEIIIDAVASSQNVRVVKLPGLLIVPQENGRPNQTYFSTREDVPIVHVQPARASHLE